MESRASLIPSLNSALLAFVMCLGAACDSAAADQFSFSARDAQDQAKADEDAANQSQAIQALVSVPCRQRVKNQKILLLIGEHNGDQWATAQDRYGPLFHVLQSRLMALGLKPVTQEQIKASIKQAEIDAYFKNDPDAAFAASNRLDAIGRRRTRLVGRLGALRVLLGQRHSAYRIGAGSGTGGSSGRATL